MHTQTIRAKTKLARNKRKPNGNNRSIPSKSKCEKAELIQEYEDLIQGSPRKKAGYSEPKTIDEYEPYLQGPSQNKYGGRRTQKIRDFRGNTYGAAGPCYTFAAEERAAVEADLRAKGII